MAWLTYQHKCTECGRTQPNLYASFVKPAVIFYHICAECRKGGDMAKKNSNPMYGKQSKASPDTDKYQKHVKDQKAHKPFENSGNTFGRDATKGKGKRAL